MFVRGEESRRVLRKRELMDEIKEGDRVVARRARGRANAIVWIVRGVTERGVYITSELSGSLGFAPGHLLSEGDFRVDYVPAEAT